MKLTTGNTEITVRQAGYDPCRIAALHRHFERLIDEKILHGAAYTLSRQGKTFAAGALGRRDFDNDKSILLPDTPFRIASITKLFVTVAIMKLVEDGLLRPDNEVQNYVPEFAREDYCKITVYDLLTHTSGMMSDWGYPDNEQDTPWYRLGKYLETYDPAADGEFNWINAVLEPTLRRKRGEEWMYCSFGFLILGELITKVSGKDVRRFIEEEILKPLGMNDSGFEVTPKLAERYAVIDAETRRMVDGVISGVDSRNEKEKRWDLIPRTAGGLTSTLTDLVKFGNMCLNKGRLGDARIVGRKIFERFTTRALNNVPSYDWYTYKPDRAYGIGFDMKIGEYIYSPGSFFHEGSGGCALIMDPAEEMVAAYFVPFAEKANDWSPEAIYNTQVVIWSGIV